MNQKGQTLIEVMIGVVLIALVFLGLFQALSVGIWGTYTNDQLSTAQQIAKSEIDYIKSQVYRVHDADGNPVVGGYLLISLGGAAITPAFANGTYTATVGGFDVEFSIDQVDSLDPDVLQQITMTVTYPGVKPQQFVAYKPHLAHGKPGKTTEVVDVPDPLPQLTGYYYLVNSGTEGQIVGATWGVTKGTIMVYMYVGIPEDLGLGPPGSSAGLSNTPADDASLADYVVGWGEGTQQVFVVSIDNLPAGAYTVYYYNPGSKSVETEMATVTYAIEP